MRSDEAGPFRNIPVLILTGRADEDSILDAVDVGIQGYVVKPTSRTMLEKHVVAELKAPPIDPEKIKR